MRVVLCALALLVPAAASASPAEEGRFFFERGAEHYRAGRYSEATEEFLLSYERAPSPGAIYNAALAATRAERPADAYSFLQVYLRQADADAARRSDAEARMAALVSTLAVVHVESDPPGATIYVDRDELGAFGTTPRDVVVEPGAHVLTLALADHVRTQASVEAIEGERREVRLRLPDLTGTLRVGGTPAGAAVVVRRDGREVARTAIGATIELPVGPYHLRVDAPGYTAPGARVHVHADHEERRTLAATAIPPPVGQAMISAGGVRARVLVDGHPVGETPARVGGLSVGEHTFVLEADGYGTWSGRRPVAANATLFVSVDLLEAP